MNQDTKIRLYKCTVWSKLTYGCVAWKLTEKTRRFLRSWNARNLFRITGRDIREETKDPTADCDLEKHVRSLRLKWVGHILRKDESFPARRMLMNDEKRYEEGSVLMDAPKHDTMEELAELARKDNKESWKLDTNVIKHKQYSTPPRVTRSARLRARRQVEFSMD